MNLATKLLQRADEGRPVRVGLIGAGKFGSMFLSQVRSIPGMHLMGIADLAPERARQALRATGWDVETSVAASFDEAMRTGRTHLSDDSEGLIRAPGLDVVIDATGSPEVSIRHALLAAAEGRHMVMVSVEGDVLAGAYLAEEFRKAGKVYSMAYGDQPALVCEMVDWVRATGFRVVAAGKGTKYLPESPSSTPDTVWDHYGISPEDAARGGMNPQMFNSFVDGTKSSIEMAAISNATGLSAPRDGLLFPPSSVYDLPEILKPQTDGGVLERAGMVEVVSSVERDGSLVANNLRFGVYVVFEPTECRRARRLRASLFPRIPRDDGSFGPLRGALSSQPSDRAGAFDQRRLGGVAQRADRLPDRVSLGRRRGGEEIVGEGRDAGRRRRLYGRRADHASRGLPGGGRVAHRSGAQGGDEGARCGG